MNKNYPILAREGWSFITLAIMFFVISIYFINPVISGLSGMICLFVIQFFRDPQRKIVAKPNEVVSAADVRLFGDPTAGISAAIPSPTKGVQRNIGKGIAAGLVPAAALLSAGGGAALSEIPAALGVPGFVQNQALDPESYGSSNSPGARYKASTMQYM